ncbi:30S ribosomal protein S6 [Limisalsivibrio acetivorans]|uniref:30S ribosomal protein S6 n=1 Tax=Limisalsivibrio acetivorans TaxID=1304888 RepID=UPI0003B42578|nr:30S ribosomal protein S6 [Limisalsivibrio acetivorans]
MNTYETVFIVRPDASQEELDKNVEFYKGLIEQNGGEIIKVEPWGKLHLAYEIRNSKEGHYFLIQYNAEHDFNDELEKRYRFNEDILRSVVVKIDEKKFKLKPKKDPTPRPDRRGGGRGRDGRDGRDNRDNRDRNPRRPRDDNDSRDNRSADRPSERPAENTEKKEAPEKKEASQEKSAE